MKKKNKNGSVKIPQVAKDVLDDLKKAEVPNIEELEAAIREACAGETSKPGKKLTRKNAVFALFVVDETASKCGFEIGTTFQTYLSEDDREGLKVQLESKYGMEVALKVYKYRNEYLDLVFKKSEVPGQSEYFLKTNTFKNVSAEIDSIRERISAEQSGSDREKAQVLKRFSEAARVIAATRGKPNPAEFKDILDAHLLWALRSAWCCLL